MSENMESWASGINADTGTWGQSVARKWQSIETAPKDGTPVDLWEPSAGRVPDCMWKVTQVHSEGIWLRLEDDDIIQPTHWMPLPEPPTSSD